MSYTVYQATNLKNNKIYFGVTSRPLKYAIWSHRAMAKATMRRMKLKPTSIMSKTPFHKALMWYGEHNFNYSIVDVVPLKNNAYANKEILIQQYDTMNPEYGYNCTTGGNESYNMSSECRNRMSISFTGKKMPDSYVKLMKARIGELHPGYGKALSKKARENMSKGQLNSDYVRTDEHKRKTSETMKKRWQEPEIIEKMAKRKWPEVTEETRRKLSKAKSGKNNAMYGRTGKLNPNYGIPITPENKQKLKEGRERYQAERRRIALEKNKTLTEKKCIHCKEIKPLDMFHKSKKLLDGHAGHCKICDRKRKLFRSKK